MELYHIRRQNNILMKEMAFLFGLSGFYDILDIDKLGLLCWIDIVMS